MDLEQLHRLMTVLLQRPKIETDFEDVTGCTYIPMSGAVGSLSPYKKNPEPIVVRGNQLTACAVNST